MAAFKARGLLTLPEYHWWYNVIQQGDVDTIKDVLSKSSKEQKDTLLNGKFVNTKYDRCEIKIRNNSDNCIFEVTVPFTLALTYSAPKEVISVSIQVHSNHLVLRASIMLHLIALFCSTP